MDVPNPNNIDIETIHRYGRKHNSGSQSVIVRFVKFSDRHSLWSKRFGLKGTSVCIREHVPDVVEQDRQLLKPYTSKKLSDSI